MTPTRIGNATVQWETMTQWLVEKLPSQVPVEKMVHRADFVYGDGTPVKVSDSFRHHTFMWFHREVAPEFEVPGEIHIIHQDERLLVVDKPPFLATMPRGTHVRQSALVRLRDELNLPNLSPMHRLDRLTSGVLAFTVEEHWRGPYQSLFDHGEVGRVYRALAPTRADLSFPVTVASHLEKQVGKLQTQVIADREANAHTLIEFEGVMKDLGVYRLIPRTGKTHQLRVHLSGLGIPIVGDPLYPDIQVVDPGDFTVPLQLLASKLTFTDPIDSTPRSFHAVRSLPLPYLRNREPEDPECSPEPLR